LSGVPHRQAILWAPDFIVSAGGVIHATAVELRHETTAQAGRRRTVITSHDPPTFPLTHHADRSTGCFLS
jgi:hypothetical protein